MFSRIRTQVSDFVSSSFRTLNRFWTNLIDEEENTIMLTQTDLKPIDIIGPFYQYIMNIVPLEKGFLEKKPEKILVLDLDNTLLHTARSAELKDNEPELLFEEQFQKILEIAKQKNTLIIIGTARYLCNQNICPIGWQASEVVKKFEKNGEKYFSAVIYTNNFTKHNLLLALKHHFNLSKKDMALVDDSKLHRDCVERKGMLAVDILGENPFEKILQFLDPTLKSEIEEPTTPVVQEYSFFKGRKGFGGVREEGTSLQDTLIPHSCSPTTYLSSKK